MAEIQQSLSTDARTASTRLVLVGEFVKEFKKLSLIAAPMVGIFLFDYLLQVVSTMMVGHLGQLQLASVAIATSVTNVVGFSFLSGLAGGLETLCGQAFGAQQYQRLGIHTNSAIISLIAICPIISAAFSLSTWLNVVLVSPYVMYSSSCKDTRAKLSKEAFLAIKQFFAFGLPSALMLCLRWWSMEMLILSSGFLPNPRLETSGLSICLAITTLHFIIPYGIGAAASTRVSNELGAGNPEAARRAAWSAVFVATLEAVIASTILFCCRFIVGYAYSNDKQVVDFIAAMTPLICLSIILDTLHAVFQGVSRGCGWQHIGACINFVAFYLVGLPVGGVLGFVVHLRGKGLWTGIVVGSAVQSTMLCLITCFTNWNKQATKAKERLRERERSSAA
ncbi:protein DETOXIFICATION 2 [Citrus sinensis]|uniref:Protein DETOXIFICATION 2 n=1 Tax=Citrus sinensis TaxID=2711 RepID=A0ACB8MYA3_CITSI|nr:protein DETOXIFICATION 2 [Citrus sinensis]